MRCAAMLNRQESTNLSSSAPSRPVLLIFFSWLTDWNAASWVSEPSLSVRRNGWVTPLPIGADFTTVAVRRNSACWSAVSSCAGVGVGGCAAAAKARCTMQNANRPGVTRGILTP